MKGVLDSIEYKMLWYKRGNLNGVPVTLRGSLNHESQEGVKLENNTVALVFNLEYKNKLSSGEFVHQFCNSSTGLIELNDKDIIRIFVKYRDGTPIDISKRDDLLQDYFVKNWEITSPNKMAITCVDVNYKVFNRIWTGLYGTNDSSTYTSKSTNTLTDTGKSWTTNQWINRTLQMESVSGQIYTYLIVSNTATVLTLHANISASVTTSYRIGHSSASAIIHALKNVVPETSYTGSFKMIINPVTAYGNSYNGGVQLLRKDGSAFPIVEYALQRQPYSDLLMELSSINAINTEYELNTQTSQMLRDMQYSVQYDTENEAYKLNWFYLDSPVKLLSGTITGVSGTTITDTSQSMSVNEYTNKLLRIDLKTYQIMSNTATTLVIDRALTNGSGIGTAYSIVGNADFIWDNESDFKNIHEYKFATNTDESFNHIYFTCGTNPLSNREIIGHKLNEASNTWELKDTFIPMKGIVREYLKIDTRFNSTTGLYEYPAYPYTPKWTGANQVTSNATYNSELKRICREKAYLKCQAIFASTKEGFLKGTIKIRGNRFIKAGDSDITNKWYASGSRILFKHVRNGIVNKNQNNGYYYLRVKSVRHAIANNKWDTLLEVEYDIYKEVELAGDLLL